MKKFFAAICAATVLLTGCSQNHAATSATVTEAKTSVTEAKTLDTITISVNGKTFTATLDDNSTARAFAEKLPLDVDMNELHGNEKYVYLDADLPSKPERVGQIHAGDLMLFGSNCVVIFYADFATSYTYTRLGKIDATDLAATLGNGNVHVTFTR